MKGIQIARALSKPLASSAYKVFNRSLFSNQFTWNQLAVKQIRLFSAETQAPPTTATPTQPEAETKKERDPLREENGLLSRYVRAGRFAEAEKIFKGLEAKGLVPNEYTYNIALNMYRHMGDLKNLFSLFEDMKKKGVSPTTVTYSTLFGAFEHGGDLKEMLKLYQEMKDSNIPLATPIFNLIFSVVGMRGELSLVESFLTEMEKLNFKPDEYTMTSVISAFGRKGDISGVLKYWDNFVNRGVRLDERSYLPVLDAYAKKGNLAGLSEWFNKFKASGLKKSVRIYNILIDGASRARNVELALQSYEEMLSSGIKPDRNTYINLFRVIGNSIGEDRSSTIDKLFNDMRETHQIPPDGRIAATMLQAFGKLRKIQKAIYVIEMVKQSKLGVYNGSLANFVDRLRRDKLIGARLDEQAIKFFSRMNQKPTSFATAAEIDEVLNLLRSIKNNSNVQNLIVEKGE